MTDPALSMEVDALYAPTRAPEKPRDPWLERRDHGFGGSDLPALFVALGMASAATVPGYIADAARPVRKGGRLGPRILLEKAGIAKPLAVGKSARVGSLREPELLAAWSRTLGADSSIDPASVTHSSVMPREMLPLVDRHCPRLAITPDAWARDFLDALVPIECKCSRYDGDDLPWYWRIQVQAQLAVLGAETGVLVLGRGWSTSETYVGPVDAWPVDRDERVIAEIREACVRGWGLVETIKKGGTV